MQCYICDGNMTKVQKDVETTWKGKTVVFKGINVYACESCGEEAYEPDDVRAMQYFIEGTIKKNEYPEIMNVEEVADFFRVSNQTIYNMLRAGKLPAVKVGREWRFPRDKIKALVFEQRQEEQPIEFAARSGVAGLSKKDADAISRHLREM
jgi:excisionase family DNA binding protein/YgiT-type zinc finger domain-containing protein